jgi:hypothetical protein
LPEFPFPTVIYSIVSQSFLSQFTLYWPLLKHCPDHKNQTAVGTSQTLSRPLTPKMDFSSKPSSFYKSTSDYCINHPSSIYAAPSSSGTKRRDEGLQELMRGIFTETGVLMCEKIVCDMHGRKHKRLGETMDLSSALEIGADDFDPNHRHVLEPSWGLYSEILVAKIAVLEPWSPNRTSQSHAVSLYGSNSNWQRLDRSLPSRARSIPVGTYKFSKFTAVWSPICRGLS